MTLVKPTLGRTARDERFLDEARRKPLNLGMLAGLTPDGIDLTLVDDRGFGRGCRYGCAFCAVGSTAVAMAVGSLVPTG